MEKTITKLSDHVKNSNGVCSEIDVESFFMAFRPEKIKKL